VSDPATSNTDPLAQLRNDLRTSISQIIGYGETLQNDAKAGGQIAFVADLEGTCLIGRIALETEKHVFPLV